MSGLLSRVIQRATHPGGGLEPLRSSLAALRALSGPATFPMEETREIVARPSPTRVAAPETRAIRSIAIPAAETRGLSSRPDQDMTQSPAITPPRPNEESLTVQMHDAPSRVVEASAHGTEESHAERPVELRDPIPTEPRRDRMTAEPETILMQAERLVIHDHMQTLQIAQAQPDAASYESTAPPVLAISIGHIEVQAPTRAPERPRTPPFRPRVSLHDFLARSGRR